MIKNIEKELVSEETLEKKLNVTLRKNTLDKESESYYASVNSQTASVKVALSNIKDEDKGIEISGTNTAGGISNFTVEFDVASEVVEAVQNLDVDEVITKNSSPVLEEVVDLERQVSDGKVTSGKPIAIKGRNLKVAENDEVYFVPQTGDETDESDKSKWIKVEGSKIFRNKPSELNLFLPDSVESGAKYKVLIQNLYFANGTERKTKLRGKSDAFEVA